VFAFDCLYHNGVSLLHEPLTKRRDTLLASIKEVPGQVTQATTKISNDVEELEVITPCFGGEEGRGLPRVDSGMGRGPAAGWDVVKFIPSPSREGGCKVASVFASVFLIALMLHASI
jgi:hypothetical protein